jgi:hypothetical protein
MPQVGCKIHPVQIVHMADIFSQHVWALDPMYIPLPCSIKQHHRAFCLN